MYYLFFCLVVYSSDVEEFNKTFFYKHEDNWEVCSTDAQYDDCLIDECSLNKVCNQLNHMYF